MDTEPRLELIIGTMFSGKSTELIRRLRRYEVVGYEVHLFKPQIDDRYSATRVVSHDQLQKESIAVQCAQDIASSLKPTTSLRRIIGIDEVQFLDSEVVSLCNAYANEGKIVLAAGLLKDFRDKFFTFSDGKKTMADLLAVADSINYFSALCTQADGNRSCGKQATRVQRFVDGEIAPVDSPVVLVGGKEAYAPRCRKHYVFYA
ncbi:MAG: thymidine kinase [Nanoarchaeota archaeon]|nr:thymidine kinase [Nanoarchaeota archaeon]